MINNNIVSKILLSTIVLAIPLYIIRFSIFGIPTTVTEIVIYFAFIVWLICRSWTKQKINWHLPWALWAWLAVGFISALVNPDVLSGLGYFKAYFFDPMLVYLIIANEYQSAKLIVPKVLIVVGLIVGAISCAGFWGWQVVADGRWLGWFGLEPFASPNYLSLFLVPIFAMSILAIWAWRSWWRYLAVASTLVIAIALWGTQSRGALIGIAGGIIVALIWYLIKKHDRTTSYRWLGLSAITLIILAAATFYFAKPDFMASPTDGRVATSNNVRWYIWQTSIEIIKQKPILGVGLGNYQNYFTEMTKDRVNYPEFISPLALSAHNLYLNIFATMGIIGLIVFIWLLCVIVKYISNTPRSATMAMVIAGLMSMLFYGLVDTPYFKNDLSLLWWIIVGLIISYHQQERKI